MKNLHYYSVHGGEPVRCFGSARNTAREMADQTGKPVDIDARDMVVGRSGFNYRVACTVRPTADVTGSNPH